ncbi:MAG: 5-formyltetrahydrofolate cyclo-ligase [Microbacterium sp.]|uniref:5-formyltetrahydrofolate cyclo-ligase n=1 Tax=Microbacterium sp. TaxID=51671 RepID=UPI0039E5AA3D
MSPGIEHAKRALRAELRERRQLLSEAQRAAAAVGVAEQLDRLVERHRARSISCYLSATTEPGTAEFLAGAMVRGIRVLLPITRADGLLDWVVATPDQEVVEAAYGVPEPVAEVLGPIAVGDVDLMIIPAASVDRTGMRLGWGRGYFDKTLGSMEGCPPVYAVVFDSEFADEVPSEPHDERVTGVVTPTRTIDLAPRTR